MNLRRHIALALLAGATIFALASCSKSTSVTTVAPVDTAPLAAPDGVTATFNSGFIQDILSWNASTSPAVASYQVYEAITNPATGGVPTRIAVLPSSVTQLMLPTVSTTCVKFYEVRSQDSSGNYSAFSTPIAVLRHAQSSGSGDNNGGSGGGSGNNKISD